MTNPDLFNRFFAPAADLADFVHILDIGPLSLPSGRLIAADPLGVRHDTPPFICSVPPGEYRVELCILSDDPRKSYGEYAATRVCFTERQAVRFEQALVGTEDPAGVEAGKSFGFPVDTGMACFCDAEVCAALCGFEEQMQQQKPDSDLYNDLWCELLEENARLHPDYQSTDGDWLNFLIPGTDYHLPLFRSGYGDGCYTTYWGIDADGNICQAFTEFIGLEDAYRTHQHKQERKNFRTDGQQNYLPSPAEKAAAVRIGISGGVLSLNGVPLDFPLSPNILVRQLGEERLTKGYCTATAYDSSPLEYAPTSFLLWDYAGILAARDDEDAYRIAALYLQMFPRTVTDTAVPLPEYPFSGIFTVDGLPFRYEAGTTLRSDRLEITASETSQGYVEIVCSNARSHRAPSHHYRTSLEENRLLALDDREHIRTLEKAEARGKDYHPGLPNKKLLLQLTKDYLTHALAALTAGYALGKNEKYLRSLLLGSLAEAALKRYEYRKIREVTLLPVLSAFILLGLDPRDFEKFATQLKASGVRDFVTDTLVRYRLPRMASPPDPTARRYRYSHGQTGRHF